ncbi:MAG: FmdB family zinc ribbon protein [Kiritimatiellia bacterium]
MPTYEYECSKCAHVFEKFQSMRDAPLKRCPKCGCKVKRLLGTGAGIIFKGQGFYQTDYRSSSYQSAAKADVSPAPSSSASSSASTSSSTSAAAASASAATPATTATASKSGGDTKAGRSAKAGRSGTQK